MNPDIQATINRLKELEQEASPAPWEFIAVLPPWTDEWGSNLIDANGNVLLQDHSLEELSDCDSELIVELRNAAPALIADQEATARKLAIYEKRMAYIAKNHPVVYAEVLKQAPEEQGGK